MSYLAPWIHTPFAQALGWTLLHFIWEGAVVALLLAVGLRVLRMAPARQRYGLACATLAVMTVAFGTTLGIEYARQPTPVAASPMIFAPLPPITMAAVPPTAPPRFTLAGMLTRLAWAVPLWIAGVFFFYLRSAMGWLALQRLRRRGVCPAAPEWQARLDRILDRMRISRPVALLESCFTDAPVLIGYLRPVILVPIGCLAGLSAGQVECILMHELAHIRRHDYIVNLLQIIVEGLLFYHPAVWWASRAVRTERENCCDDAVVEMMGDARSYAATLAILEQRRSLVPEVALAATGGNLMHRIRRLTAEPRRSQPSMAPGVSASVLLVLFAAGLTALPPKIPVPHRAPLAAAPKGVALTPQPARKSRQEATLSAHLATPYRKWIDEDVAYIITAAERDAFAGLESDDQRERFIESFWKHRDPTPDTEENEFKEEHYRRIAYSNQNFGDGTPGWKSDRGRIYITYGPPDSRNGEGGTHEVWMYRFIEGMGRDVRIDFNDGQLNTPAPGAAGHLAPQADEQARVFVAPNDAGVSVIVPKRVTRPTGTIAAGDVVRIAHDTGTRRQETRALEQEIDNQRVKLAALRQRYRDTFPEVDAAKAKIRTLEEQLDSMVGSADHGFEGQLAGLRSEENRLRLALTQSQMILLNYQRDADRLQPELMQVRDHVFVDSAARTSMTKQLSLLNESILQEKQKQLVLESTLAQNMSVQHEVAEKLADAPAPTSYQVTVRPDGRISFDNTSIAAAGLTFAELRSEIQRQRGWRNVQVSVSPGDSVSKPVTVLVPLENASQRYYVYIQVTTTGRRVVQSNDDEIQSQRALAKVIPLRAGTYHLEVVTKNMATGRERKSALDFTVD